MSLFHLRKLRKLNYFPFQINAKQKFRGDGISNQLKLSNNKANNNNKAKQNTQNQIEKQ